MHDLRTQVYRHLQRLSLAFFTRTRTGEIQSRIANDIGGVQNVVTSDRGVDRLQRDDGDRERRRHGPARLAPGAVLASRCCRSSCCSRAAWATSGARSPRSSRARWPTSPRSCRSRCRCPGILLGKTMGRGAELADRFEGESENLADLEVRSRMAGRWMMAAIQTSFAVMPALVYLFAGLAPGRGLDRHDRRVHDAADPALLPRPVAAERRPWTSRPRPRCSTASSSTSTCQVDIEPGDARAARRARRGALRRRLVPLRRRAGRCATSTSPSRRARAPRWSARPARARRRSATSPRGSTTRSAAPCGSTASTCAS